MERLYFVTAKLDSISFLTGYDQGECAQTSLEMNNSKSLYESRASPASNYRELVTGPSKVRLLSVLLSQEVALCLEKAWGFP